jgi:hypothetical protein
MEKHVVVTVEERLVAWREAEQAAAAAEQLAAAPGQGSADPRAGDLFIRASELRQQADRQFAAVLRAVKLDEHGDNRGESANESRPASLWSASPR